MSDTFRLLVRTFIERMFESDLMPSGLPQVQLVIGGAVLLIGPGLLLPFELYFEYTLVFGASPHTFDIVTWPHKLLFLSFSMLALGIISLVIWDGLYPDRRDAMVLSPLPLRPSTIVTARIVSLVVLVLIFSLGANLIASLLYGTVVGSFYGVTGILRGIAAHFIASTSASVFVFFCLLAFQGALINLLPRRFLPLATLALQLAFVVMLFEGHRFISGGLSAMTSMVLDGSAGGRLVDWSPPMWFLGLYEVILGSPRPGFPDLALRAVIGLIAVTTFALALYAVSYQRLVRRALESGAESRTSLEIRKRRPLLFPRAVARELGVCSFAVLTLLRSRKHRLLLAIYLGAGAALSVPTLVAGGHPSGGPPPSVLAVPLVLLFFGLVGSRMLLSIPLEMDANWVFRLTESTPREAYVSGTRAALLLVVAAPILVATLVTFSTLWSLRVAVAHTIFCGLMALLLAELLLVGYRKVPFTCSYLPGKARVRVLWPAYLTAFWIYSYVSTRVEAAYLPDRSDFATVLGILAAAWIAVLIVRRSVARTDALVYEEEPPDLVTTLDLALTRHKARSSTASR